MEAARQAEYYTIDDIYALPEGQRAELIDGQIYMMATPSMVHQRIVMELSYQIENYIRSHNGNCEVFPAPFAVFLNADDKTYVEPDISVICDNNKLNDKGCNGAPDWIIEVVSPSSRSMDFYKKLLKYRTARVREYWIVDYEKKQVMVYNFESDEMTYYTFDDKVKVGIYENFEINFNEIKLQ